MIAGVLGGVSESLGWPPKRVRIVYMLVLLLSGVFPGVLAYLVLWYLMPRPDVRGFRLEDFRQQ